MIAVLFATFGVAASGLDVAEFAEADPDVGPGGRNDQGAGAIEIIFVVDWLSLRVDIDKSAPFFLAVDAGLGVIDPFEAGLAGGF